MESDIRGYGNGYGSKHNWERLETRQLPYTAPIEQKCTKYKCRDCGEVFAHHYGINQDIFEAMKDAKVKEQCNNHTKLQEDFMKLINQMKEVKCKLPQELQFYYKIKEEKGQFEVTPYLTKEDALRSCRWYDSDDFSDEEECEYIIYREEVDKADFKVIGPITEEVKSRLCCGHI